MSKRPPALGTRRPADVSPVDWVLSHSVEADGGCWQWQGYLDPKGYGHVSRQGGGGRVKTHRLVWEEFNGLIPDGLVIDHLCRNRACVNPEHLDVVTIAENTRRGESLAAQYARRTHCTNGHPLIHVPGLEGRTCSERCSKTAGGRRDLSRPYRSRDELVTECRRGHAYTPENTYAPPNGSRECRTCRSSKPHRRTSP